ncbi:hypothetical protein T1E_2464 [Pseudomonas putida DOT-T1E]|uniref:Uncharacterized protein n=1 Tax=Pseudomonas putida (strain DOT-T1E) TaxID=1196325 RepID=I7C5B6_PSEPT|nr:hypothetical protein T1E_2464 [Pseudomonas putida DOT-T1E]
MYSFAELGQVERGGDGSEGIDGSLRALGQVGKSIPSGRSLRMTHHLASS